MKKVITTFAAILVCGGVCLLCGCSPQTGVRSGQVLNAVNNEPIQSAVVSFCWRFGGVLAMGPIGGKHFETSTDKDGKYFVPSQTIDKPNILYGNLEEKTLIYKDGYAIYVVDLSMIGPSAIKPIGYPDDNQTYYEKNNIVKLYPWKEGESHERHIDWIDNLTFPYGQGELLKKELEPERKRAREERLMKRAEKKRAKEQTQK
jgi:hypothetical protein